MTRRDRKQSQRRWLPSKREKTAWLEIDCTRMCNHGGTTKEPKGESKKGSSASTQKQKLCGKEHGARECSSTSLRDRLSRQTRGVEERKRGEISALRCVHRRHRRTVLKICRCVVGKSRRRRTKRRGPGGRPSGYENNDRARLAKWAN